MKPLVCNSQPNFQHLYLSVFCRERECVCVCYYMCVSLCVCVFQYLLRLICWEPVMFYCCCTDAYSIILFHSVCQWHATTFPFQHPSSSLCHNWLFHRHLKSSWLTDTDRDLIFIFLFYIIYIYLRKKNLKKWGGGGGGGGGRDCVLVWLLFWGIDCLFCCWVVVVFFGGGGGGGALKNGIL